jgi:hypothetical protein
LTTMTERLEENWFHHFLANPQRFSPLTIMPGFWPDGKSPLPDVLGGDSGKQRDVLWQYLERGPEAREPQGLVLEPLVISVPNEAVIIRRAFPGIGKRGIGVGYPGGINLSFDAGQMRLGSIWSGGFIEASGLWRGQGSGQARILGKDTTPFPPGPAFAVLASPEAAWPALDATPGPSPHSFGLLARRPATPLAPLFRRWFFRGGFFHRTPRHQRESVHRTDPEVPRRASGGHALPGGPRQNHRATRCP